MGHSAFVVGERRDIICLFQRFRVSIFHSNSQTGIFQHGNVIESVPAGHDFLPGKAQISANGLQSLVLCHALGSQLQKIGFCEKAIADLGVLVKEFLTHL